MEELVGLTLELSAAFPSRYSPPSPAISKLSLLASFWAPLVAAWAWSPLFSKNKYRVQSPPKCLVFTQEQMGPRTWISGSRFEAGDTPPTHQNLLAAPWKGCPANPVRVLVRMAPPRRF